MRIIDPDDIAGRELAVALDNSSLIVDLYRKEQEMFDKQAQRARAQNLSATLAQQGLVPPVLPMPVVRAPVPAPGTVTSGCQAAAAKKAAKIYKDCRGKEIKIGDTVAFARYGYTSLHIEKITGFSKTGKSARFATGSSKDLASLVLVA